MKRMKLNRGATLFTTVYQGDGNDQGNRVNEENTNETMGFRMLENLKMALLFSRIQNQMNDNERQNV